MSFDPVTLAVMTAVTAITGAIGSVMAGKAAAQAGKANAQMLRQQAGIRQQQGAIQADRVRKQYGQMRGAQMAAYAAAGIDVLAPSPMEIASETFKEFEWRAESARWQGEAEAVQLRNQASLQKWQGQQTRNQYYVQAAGQLFAGATKAYSILGQPGSSPTTSTQTPGFTGFSYGYGTPPGALSVSRSPVWVPWSTGGVE